MPVIPNEFLSFLQTNLPAITHRFGTPCHLFYGPGIRGSVRGINAAFGSQGLDITELFAFKANPRLAIAKIILEEGGGLDVSSYDEVLAAIELNCPPDKTMLTSNNTPQRLYQLIAKQGGFLNLDDPSFVPKVPEPFPKTICFRLLLNELEIPSVGATANQINFVSKDTKFGVPMDQVDAAYEAAIRRGAESIGLHAMVVSNNRDYRALAATVRALAKKGADLGDKFHVPVPYLNMGGGEGIAYRDTENDFDMGALAVECRLALEIFQARMGYKPRLFMESGRYVAGPHGVMINRVENVYTKFKKFVGVQIAMQGVPRMAIYETAFHKPIVFNPDGTLKTGPTEVVSIVGGTCEGSDGIGRDVELPIVAEGDFIVTCCSGAHCNGQAGQYNWQPRPQELLYDKGEVRRICTAETYHDFTYRQRGLSADEHWLKLS